MELNGIVFGKDVDVGVILVFFGLIRFGDVCTKQMTVEWCFELCWIVYELKADVDPPAILLDSSGSSSNSAHDGHGWLVENE